MACLMNCCVFFCSEYFVAREVRVTDLDLNGFAAKVQSKGEKFSLSKHTQGTEIKAITYSNMQILQSSDRVDVYVIVDI